jgi:soluble lytic murein transglycosylase-like protein
MTDRPTDRHISYICHALEIGMLAAVFAIAASIYFRDSTKRMVVKEACGHTTFLKMLVLKPGLDYELARAVAEVVDEAARDFNKDPDFILAIMSVESHFDPKATSSAGALGLMQVMPLWLKVLGTEGEDLFDPSINVRRGLQVYSSYEQMFKSKELALTAYNRGSWKVEEDLRRERDPRNGYAKEVLDVYERLKLMQ